MAVQLQGIDVSHFQGNVNWQSVKSAGQAFAFAKATQGTTYTDPMFSANWGSMGNAGVLRGAYHFFQASEDAAAQADYFLKVVSLASGDLPPVIDVEITDGVSQEALQSGVLTWLQTVQEKTGITPIIYTGPSFWNEYFSASFGSYPLWIAQYGVSSPTLPRGWSGWHFWQHSESGSVEGVSGSVDLNFFNGSLQQLLAFVNSSGNSIVSQPIAVSTYTVQPGDTLSGIAAGFGVPVNALVAANGIQNPNMLQAGQVLQIPRPS